MDVSAATKVHDTVQTTLSLEHATDAVTLSFNAFVNDKLQLREQLAQLLLALGILDLVLEGREQCLLQLALVLVHLHGLRIAVG